MTMRVVVGPPCSGKSTFAWSQRGPIDLTVDYDRIAVALGSPDDHGAEGIIANAAYRARLSSVRVALESAERGDSDGSWVIHSHPSEDHITEYLGVGAEFYVIDPGLEVCLSRCDAESRPEGTADRIRAWYENPPTFPESANVTPVTEVENKMTQSRLRRTPPTSEGFARINMIRDEAADEGRGGGRAAEILIYGEIGYWDVDAEQFARDIADLDVDDLQVHINSPGGAAWDGVAIMNALRRHKARVTVTVDGLAASAASVIAMGADEIIMNRGAQMMIHDASGYAYGPAELMEGTAELLHKLSDSLADIYAARAGGTSAKWRDAMRAESWYTATEAVEAGLADRWVDAPAVEAHFPEVMARSGGKIRPHFDVPAVEPVNRKGNTMPTFVDSVRDRLGLPGEATDEDVLTALDKALDAATEPPAPGAVMIDEGVLAALKSDAAAGREALDMQARTRREDKVQAALTEGRISPASAGEWLTALEADEDRATALLATLAKNTVPVVEVGHSNDDKSPEDALYAAAWGDDKEGA